MFSQTVTDVNDFVFGKMVLFRENHILSEEYFRICCRTKTVSPPLQMVGSVPRPGREEAGGAARGGRRRVARGADLAPRGAGVAA